MRRISSAGETASTDSICASSGSTREDKEVLHNLIGDADTFIHSMRAMAIAKLGFDYPQVSAINPKIIYTNCYDYGHCGPYKDRPAYDDTIQAE